MGSPTAVYVGIKGCVLALDRATGTEIWRAALKGSDFVNVTASGGDLLATTRGEIYCLDSATGHVHWHNPLRGLGFGLCTVAPAEGLQTPVAAAKRRRDEAAAASAAAAS